jgi:hypothetical protein
MWKPPVAYQELLALAADLPLSPSERRFKRGAELLALGGPGAVMAAADKSKATADDEDDWSGGFDIHLGVYTCD